MNQTEEEARTQIKESTVDGNLAFLFPLGLHKHQPLFMRIDTDKRKTPKGPFQMMSKVRARINGKLATKNCLKSLSRKKLAAKYPMKHPETGKRMSRAEIIKQARSKRKDGQQLNLREMKLLYQQDMAELKRYQKKRLVREETRTAKLHHE